MEPKQLFDRLHVADRAAFTAKHLLGEMFGKPLDGLRKLALEIKPEDGDTPRTVIDKNVGALIKDEIRNVFPHDHIVEEESGMDAGDNDWCWWVDPFDGTANAEPRLPLSVIGIGVSFQGEMVIGVIANPFENTVTSAAQGRGAFMNGERLRVAAPREFPRRFIVVDALFNAQTAGPKSQFLNDLGTFGIAQNVRMVGSNLLAWSLVAQGRVDAALMDAVGGHWDAAAGIPIIREAGGAITDLEGNTPKPGEYHVVLAANDAGQHAQLLGMARKFYAGYQGFRKQKK